MIPHVVYDFLVFSSIVFGLALFADRWLRFLEPGLERLGLIVATSFTTAGLSVFGVYLLSLPSQLLWLLPVLGFAQLVLSFKRGSWLWNDPPLRLAFLAWLLLAAWCLGLLGLIISYSGGGWSFDWLEHYKRTLLFLGQQPAHTPLPGGYELTARPPLANWFVAACMGNGGHSFVRYQIFSTLSATLVFFPILVGVRRIAGKLGSREIALTCLLSMASPFLIQNATFAWTKLPATFFILSGLLLLARSLSQDKRPCLARAGWLCLASGLLCHYSAAPWILAAIAGVTIARRREFITGVFWREQRFSALACLLLLIPWFLWSWVVFGSASTLSSNTSAQGLQQTGWLGQASVTLSNLWNTLVPHFVRTLDRSLLDQSSLLGQLRDHFFSLYQVNLPFLVGGGACLCLVFWLRSRPFAAKTNEGGFWLTVIPLGAVLGVAVHTIPDAWGLAHISLQPLGLLGLALLAGTWHDRNRLQRIVLGSLISFDLLFGIILHFAIQSFLPWRLSGGPLQAATAAASLSTGGRYNHAAKLEHGIEFLGEKLLPHQLLLCVLLASLALGILLWNKAAGRKLPASKTKRRGWTWALILASGVVAATTAAWMLWSSFMIYDDEGYILQSLRAFSEHGSLYGTVFTQYGPFHHLLGHGLQLLGAPLTTETARLWALFAWVGTSAFCAAAVWRLSSGRIVATWFCGFATLAFLWPMSSEPSHPGGLTSLLIAFCAWAGCRRPLQPLRLALLVGLVGAALVLTKINVGLLMLAGAGTWLIFHSSLGLRHPALRIATALLLLAIPWILTRPLLGEGWAVLFALVVSIGAGCCLLTAPRDQAGPVQLRHLLLSGAGFVLLALTTLVLLRLRGTTWTEMLDGILLSPLQMPSIFTNPVRWRTGTTAVLAGSLVLALAWWRTGGSARLVPWLAALRILLVLAFAALWTGLVDGNFHALVMSYGLSLTWLFVVPLERDNTTVPARLWLALLFLPQALHAFPVAGSQISWGCFLWLPLASLGFAEACTVLVGLKHPLLVGLGRMVPKLILGVTLIGCVQGLELAWNRHGDGQKLDLPGARKVVLPENFTTTARILVDNIREAKGPLFTLPGLLSLNHWSGAPTPTPANATHWFTLLPLPEQERIRTVLEKNEASCLVIEHSVLDYLRERGIKTDSPLALWLEKSFRPVFRIESYEFLVRTGREFQALGIARARQDGESRRTRVELNLHPSVPIHVTRVELRQLAGNQSLLLQAWEPGQMAVLKTPLGNTGEATAAASLSALPLDLEGRMRLYLFTDQFPSYLVPETSLLVFLDADGRRVAEARFSH